MRILLVSDHFPPFVGGVQRQTMAMADELTSRGHQVGVVTVWQDGVPAFEDTAGYPVWRVRQIRTLPWFKGSPHRRHQPPVADPITALSIRRIIRRFRPDVVHSSGWMAYSAAGALLRSKVPHVISVREYGYICANASLLHKGKPCSGPAPLKCLACSSSYFGPARGWMATVGIAISRPLLRHKTAAVHSVSNYVRDEVVERLFDGATREMPDVVIPSFRVNDGTEPDPEALSRLPDTPFILFVGALRRVKGLEILLVAYARLDSPPPLVLIGTREADTPAVLPPGVVELGPASYATVMAAWDRAMFGVMPSLWPEPFGSVVHEAMSRGKAVIGTTPGGHEDMIEDAESGLLVPGADVEALTRAMQSMIADPEMRDRLGKAAQARAQNFDAQAIIPQFEDLYAATGSAPSSV